VVVEMFVSSTVSRPRRLPSLLVTSVIAYVAAIATAQTVAVTVGPLQGASCFALMFVALVNLTILAYLREADAAAGHVWRLLAVAAIPPLERLLMLCMPPLHWGQLEEYVFWSVPLVLGAMVLLRTPLLSQWRDLQPRLVHTRKGGYGLSGLTGQLLVAVAGGGLGLGAGLLAEGQLRPVGDLLQASEPAWFGIIVFVFAGCSQELVYRAVIQPAATAAGGWAGVVASSMLMASAWLAWVGVVVAVPVVAASLVFGWAVRRGNALIGVLAGRGLFSLALALLWHRVLL
jgi:membrane protease YdiL (CAAX protease family)